MPLEALEAVSEVRVVFFGYANSSQMTCLQLMAKKIAVAQSASGDSVEMALARRWVGV